MLPGALLLTLLSAGQAGENQFSASHKDANPVYRTLLDQGVFEGKTAGRLPLPTMPDGLDAAGQRKLIEELGKPRHDFKSLTRNTTVAPHLVDIHTIESGDAKRPLQSIEFWFVAHADMSSMSDKDFLDSLLTADDSEGATLTGDDLKQRGIPPVNGERESYGQIIFPLLKKVRLYATGHSYWSRTKDSLLTAAVIDARFNGDPKFPNQWKPIDREGKIGAPQPYTGAGLYMKLTQLHEPSGAVFVECHILGVEPYDWFKGRNLLRSKLPPAIQSQVRGVRRKMLELKR